MEFGERIPIGVIYQTDRPVYGASLPTYRGTALVDLAYDREDWRKAMMAYA
jgi:hypothetical protein